MPSLAVLRQRSFAFGSYSCGRAYAHTGWGIKGDFFRVSWFPGRTGGELENPNSDASVLGEAGASSKSSKRLGTDGRALPGPRRQYPELRERNQQTGRDAVKRDFLSNWRLQPTTQLSRGLRTMEYVLNENALIIITKIMDLRTEGLDFLFRVLPQYPRSWICHETGLAGTQLRDHSGRIRQAVWIFRD
ncbi:MAG: hypothetical protein WCO56_18045 [Verrucomicrobiota bacterium]